MSEPARDLAATLSERFGTLPPKQQAVARLLSQGAEAISFASVASFAARAGVDPATVVRTCQSLGYSGWKEFQDEVRSTLAGKRTFAERVEALGGSADNNLTERVRRTALDNVAKTFDNLDHAVLEQVAATINRAGLVVIVAGGVSSGAGVFLESSLQLVGCRAVLVAGIGEAATALAAAGPADVMVAISMWRYLRSTIQTLEQADALGIETVAVTDSQISPAALIARHRLIAHTATVGPRMGQTGIMALLELLVAQVALVDPARSVAAARVANGIYQAGNVLGGPQPPSRGGDWDLLLQAELTKGKRRGRR